MMRVFGGRSEYLQASEDEVLEQTLVWLADLKAENERKEKEQKELDKLR
jgi:hypothetical protein